MFACRCTRHDDEAPSTELLDCGTKALNEIYSPLHTDLTALQLASVTKLATEVAPPMSDGSWKSHSSKFFKIYPCLAEQVSDYQPSAHVMVSLAERDLDGEITPELMIEARAIVEKANNARDQRSRMQSAQQVFEPFIQSCRLNAPFNEFLLKLPDYEKKIQSLGQRTVSIAGDVHELVVVRALESVGLTQSLDVSSDFFRPTKPKGKQGDIVVRSTKRPDALYRTEVKSLSARERFQRGLDALEGEHRVGFGFFNNPSEFNETTVRLLSRVADAVYMPPQTLKELDGKVKNWMNNRQAPFFRPVHEYPIDMKNWARNGTEL